MEKLFYEDEKLIEYENLFLWDVALGYLEELYANKKSIDLLNTLIGCAWYYMVEGPIESRLYEEDKSCVSFICWKRYLDIGINTCVKSPYFYFIAGYTLSLHGFLIDAKYGSKYEENGIVFMKRCSDLSKGLSIKAIAENFLINTKSKKYIPLQDKNMAKKLFKGNLKLLKYFQQMYGL